MTATYLNEQKLNILPSLTNVVETHFTMETYEYTYDTTVDEFGDREITDTSSTYKLKMTVPIISFVEWINTLYLLKTNGVETTHLYSREFKPYKPDNRTVWRYFDEVKGNLLSNGYPYVGVKVRIYVYFIKEFNFYAVLRILSHHDIVSCIET